MVDRIFRPGVPRPDEITRDIHRRILLWPPSAIGASVGSRRRRRRAGGRPPRADGRLTGATSMGHGRPRCPPTSMWHT